MTQHSRDPRVDPEPGDVLKDQYGLMMIVSVQDQRVRFCRVGAKSIYDASISEWGIHSSDDEVLHVA